MNPQAAIAANPASTGPIPNPPDPDMTDSIHTEPLDQLGDKLRSWKHTTRERRKGRALRSSCFDTSRSGSGSVLDDEGDTMGHQTDERRDEAVITTQLPASDSISSSLHTADSATELESEETRCRCCLRYLLLPSDRTPNQDGSADDEHQAVTGCETAREIKALDSDLLLSAEIGLTLLNRLNTLQASYDPLLISHTTLQTTYAELARTNHSYARRQAEMTKDLQEKERERERLEKELVGGREREEGLEREVKRLEGRLRRFNLAGQRTRAGGGGGGGEDEDQDQGPGEGPLTRSEQDTGKKTQEEWEEDFRAKESVVMDLVAQNALLQHQLDRARLQAQSGSGSGSGSGSKSMGNSPALGYSPTVPSTGERTTTDELDKRKKLQRLSLGYRSGSYSGPYSSTPASASSSTGPVGLGFGRGTRHHSENALWTLNSASASDSNPNPTPVNVAGDDPENDSQAGSAKRGKLRPLSLSLSVSSRYSHAGPSSTVAAAVSAGEDAGHARKVSMAASLRSTTSAQAGQVHDRDHWKSPRESWVSSSTGIGMGAGGWDPDSIVREADGTPVWPQPSRQVVSAAGQAQAGTNGWRSGSGSGSETTSPRISMRAGAGSVGYSLNGVKRSMSVDRSSRGGIRRASGNQTVESIAETTGQDETHERSTSNATSEMLSDPAVGTTRQRKRMSRYFHTPAYRPPTSPLINEEFSFAASSEPDSMVEGDRTSDSERPEERPARMVDSKSTQTEPEPEVLREETPRMKHDAQVRLTLAGLGIEEDTPNSSSRTTPQLSAAFSPASPFNPSHHAREIVDSRTGALLALIEHVSKILLRLRQADVPNLTRRLKKHHLAGGDVGHLSRGEMKALEKEIGDMRTHFRSVVEDERRLGNGNGKNPLHDSMITKKDFQLLLKLFKEIFGELIELRGIVNDVTVNPAVAVELRKRQEAIQAEEEEARGRGKAVKNASGLGWIAAPITKLFAAPSSDPPAKRASDKALLQPPAIRSSAKLMPSTSATTTQVSVEFASTGQIRRATAGLPVVNTDHMDELPVSPSDTLTKIPGVSRQAPARTGRTPAIPLGDGSSRGPPPGNNRQSLYGIFAGGAQGVPPRMNQTISGRPASGRHRRQLSTVVDAVIDDDGPDRGLDDYQPPLLERTLRPRGLSDSSIRTTFQHHGIEIPAGRDDLPAPNLYGSYWPATSVVKTLGRRIQALTGGTQPLPPSSMSTSTADDSSLSQDTTVVASPDVTTTTNATLQVKHNEPRAIIRKRSANQLGPSPASLTDGGGFLSMLSSSSTNEPYGISSKHSSPGMQRSESRTRRSRAHLQS